MKKFEFSLQRLYDVKETEEDQRRLELQELEKKMAGLVRQLQDTIDNFNGQKALYTMKCRKGISTFDLKNFGDYFQYLIGEMEAINNQIVDCEAEIEVCRQQLLKLMNEKKVLDRMREEQLQEYHAELARFNEREIEDFMQGRL